MKTQRVSGWGLYPVGNTILVPFRLECGISQAGIARGLGRSYGDASFLSGGYTWEMQLYRKNFSCNPSTGSLTVDAGFSLKEIIERVVPEGFFPPVVPGTQFVTVGGAFASNIHGKNHHLQGSFAEYADWIELYLPNGEIRKISPEEELFWATAGGMGLTGIILRLSLRLTPIPSSFILSEVHKAPRWEKVIEILQSQEMRYPFAVAWIDHFHKHNRGVIHLGRWAEKEELPPTLHKKPYQTQSNLDIKVPFLMPFSLFNRWSRALISSWYWDIHKPGSQIIGYKSYFFPLDRVREWNRLWGSKGFIQFQLIVPTVEGLVEIWKLLRQAPAKSFLTVLKRLGPQKGHLAFSGPGWTLAIDLPNSEEVRRFLQKAIEEVLKQGGKIYLTKDSLLSPSQFRAAYPQWERFLEIKAQVDPSFLLRSDLSKRIALTP
ncbi:MAG: FAD-binding oxidoreductase [Bacteroidia bacterium]|nr:FAD-binding oxidoreductase [Bacteroidia bacterium]MDW8134761.1 FAD-binding oxidoreductase [Bacteroidia bacterium]